MGNTIGSPEWEDIEKRFPVGKRVPGVVSEIKHHGAFVTLEDGVKGFISNFNLSWERDISNPKDVLGMDQKVEALVLKVNKEKEEIKLGYKQADDLGWNKVCAKYVVGCVTTGTISKIDSAFNFAIVKLEPGVEGFLGKRDVPRQDVASLSEGCKVEVHIRNHDKKLRQIKLTMLAKLKDEKGADIVEGSDAEFKASILYSAKDNELSTDQFLVIAEQIAAFANTHGGDLYLGVNDQGYVEGIENDLAHLNDVSIPGYDETFSYRENIDQFLLKITHIVRWYLGKPKEMLINPIICEEGGVKYVKIHINSICYNNSNDIVYVKDKRNIIYFRNASGMTSLPVRQKDEFLKMRATRNGADSSPQISGKSDQSETMATEAAQETKQSSCSQQTVNKSSDDSQTSGVPLQGESTANEVLQSPNGKPQPDAANHLNENANKSQGEQKHVKESGKPKSANSQGCGCTSPTGQDGSAPELRKDYVDYPVTQVQMSSVRIQILEAFLRCFCSEWSPISLVSRLFRQKTGIDVKTFVGYDLDTLSRDPVGDKLLKWRRADKYPHKLEVSAIGGKMGEPSPRTVSRVRKCDFLKDAKPEDVDYDQAGKVLHMRPEMVMVAHVLRKVD